MLPLILVAAAVHVASAVPQIPQATAMKFARGAIEGFSPAPTGMAKIGNFLELFKRQNGENTCGYISGISTRSITCNDAGYICATNTLGGQGCCPATNLAGCYIATGCVPYASLPACNAACMSNSFLTKCGAAAPSCQFDIYLFSNTQMTYNGCAVLGTVLTILTTYTPVPTTYIAVSTASSATSAAVTSSKPTTISSSLTTPSSSTTPTTSTMSPTGGSSSTSQSSSTTNSQTPIPVVSGGKSNTPIGPIVGGAIGGFAILCALIFAIFFFLARKKKENNAQTPGPAPEAASGPTYGGAVAAGYYQPAQPDLKSNNIPVNTYQVPSESSQPKFQGQQYIPPPGAQVPQGQHIPPPVSQIPGSPAPAYEQNQYPNNQQHTNMLDGRQVWPVRQGAYEVQG